MLPTSDRAVLVAVIECTVDAWQHSIICTYRLNTILRINERHTVTQKSVGGRPRGNIVKWPHVWGKLERALVVVAKSRCSVTKAEGSSIPRNLDHILLPLLQVTFF